MYTVHTYHNILCEFLMIFRTTAINYYKRIGFMIQNCRRNRDGGAEVCVCIFISYTATIMHRMHPIDYAL